MKVGCIWLNYKYLPVNLVVVWKFDQMRKLFFVLDWQCHAVIGGWCETYSDMNSKSEVRYSYVSPSIGLNGLLNPSSTEVSWVMAKAAIYVMRRIGSCSAEACCNNSWYSKVWAYFCKIEVGSFKKTGTVI